MNNLRQLQVAWQIHAVDHGGRLCVASLSRNDPSGTTWVDGSLMPINSSPAAQTDRALLLQAGPGRLGPWVRQANVYHCPSDRSTTNVFGRKGPLRSRSYSMNWAFGLGSGGPAAPAVRRNADGERPEPDVAGQALGIH